MIDRYKFAYVMFHIYSVIFIVACVFIFVVSQDVDSVSIHYKDGGTSSSRSRVLLDNSTLLLNSSSCYNMTVEDTVKCVVEFVDPFFKYNETDDSLNLTLDDLKSRGGDCKDWTEFYIRELSKYNFSGQTVSFFVEKQDNFNIFHDYALVNKGDVYCNIDQQDYKCYTLGLSEENETNTTI